MRMRPEDPLQNVRSTGKPSGRSMTGWGKTYGIVVTGGREWKGGGVNSSHQDAKRGHICAT